MAETITPSSNTAAAASGNGDDDDCECSTFDDWVEFFKFKKGRDSASEARNGLLVVAVFITTATYQAVLSPPGGLWQDTTKPTEFGVNGHEAGKTILGSNSVYFGFGIFIIANTAGFFCSLFVIEILTEGFPLRLELWFIIVALIASYDSAMTSIIPQGRFRTLFSVLTIILPLIFAIVARLVRKARILSHRRGQRHRKVSRVPLQMMESSSP